MASSKTMGFKTLAIATSMVANVAMGGYLLVVRGSASVDNAVNFSSNTGVLLQVGGLTRVRTNYVQCTGTGGLSKYSKCNTTSPFTTSGTLLAFALECGNNVVSQSGDVSFKKTSLSNTGTVLTNGDNLVAGTGANKWSQLAVPVIWNPADRLTFSTATSPTGTQSTARYDCRLWYTASDAYGS